MERSIRLFLDACALICRFEGAAEFRADATDLIAQLTQAQPSVELVVSRLLVWSAGSSHCTKAIAHYSNNITFFAAVTIVELKPAVVELATNLRVRHGLKTPDVLQATCALSLLGETVFVAGDLAFTKVLGLDVRLIVSKLYQLRGRAQDHVVCADNQRRLIKPFRSRNCEPDAMTMFASLARFRLAGDEESLPR